MLVTDFGNMQVGKLSFEYLVLTGPGFIHLVKLSSILEYLLLICHYRGRASVACDVPDISN